MGASGSQEGAPAEGAGAATDKAAAKGAAPAAPDAASPKDTSQAVAKEPAAVPPPEAVAKEPAAPPPQAKSAASAAAPESAKASPTSPTLPTAAATTSPKAASPKWADSTDTPKANATPKAATPVEPGAQPQDNEAEEKKDKSRRGPRKRGEKKAGDKNIDASGEAADGAASGSKEAKSSGKGGADGKTAKGPGVPKIQLCVKNLAGNAKANELRALFEPVVNVQQAVVKSDESGNCRGFGFISVLTMEEANKAIAELNKRDFGGKAITVEMAEKQPRNAEVAKSGGKGKGKGEAKGKSENVGKGEGKKGKSKGGGKSAPAGDYAAMQQAYVAQAAAQAAYYQQYQLQANQYANVASKQQEYQMQQYQAQQQMAAYYQYGQQLVAMAYQQPQPGAAARHAANKTADLTGVIKLVKKEKKPPHGFISCEDVQIKDANGKLRDVYFELSLLPEGSEHALAVGAPIRFTYALTDKGTPKAVTASLA